MSHNVGPQPAPASPLAKLPQSAAKVKLNANGSSASTNSSASRTSSKTTSSSRSPSSIESSSASRLKMLPKSGSTKTKPKPLKDAQPAKNPSSSSSSSSRPASATVASQTKRSSVPTSSSYSNSRPASASSQPPLHRARSANPDPSASLVTMNAAAHAQRSRPQKTTAATSAFQSPAFDAAQAFARRGSGSALGSGSYDKQPQRGGSGAGAAQQPMAAPMSSPRNEESATQKKHQKRRSKYSRHYRTASSAKATSGAHNGTQYNGLSMASDGSSQWTGSGGGGGGGVGKESPMSRLRRLTVSVASGGRRSSNGGSSSSSSRKARTPNLLRRQKTEYAADDVPPAPPSVIPGLQGRSLTSPPATSGPHGGNYGPVPVMGGGGGGEFPPPFQPSSANGGGSGSYERYDRKPRPQRNATTPKFSETAAHSSTSAHPHATHSFHDAAHPQPRSHAPQDTPTRTAAKVKHRRLSRASTIFRPGGFSRKSSKAIARAATTEGSGRERDRSSSSARFLQHFKKNKGHRHNRSAVPQLTPQSTRQYSHEIAQHSQYRMLNQKRGSMPTSSSNQALIAKMLAAQHLAPVATYTPDDRSRSMASTSASASGAGGSRPGSRRQSTDSNSVGVGVGGGAPMAAGFDLKRLDSASACSTPRGNYTTDDELAGERSMSERPYDFTAAAFGGGGGLDDSQMSDISMRSMPIDPQDYNQRMQMSQGGSHMGPLRRYKSSEAQFTGGGFPHTPIGGSQLAPGGARYLSPQRHQYQNGGGNFRNEHSDASDFEASLSMNSTTSEIPSWSHHTAKPVRPTRPAPVDDESLIELRYPVDTIVRAEKLKITRYAGVCFRSRRKVKGGMFRRKEFVSVEEVLRFQDTPIRSPLTRLRTKDKEAAVDNFRRVMTFMGDLSAAEGSSSSRRSSSGPDPSQKALDAILAWGMREQTKNNARAPEARKWGVRDEIFCQICKQLLNNPGATSTLLGWKLMTICVTALEPSPAFHDSLLDFCQRHVMSKSVKSNVMFLAGYCDWYLTSLARTGDLTDRIPALPSRSRPARGEPLTVAAVNDLLRDGVDPADLLFNSSLSFMMQNERMANQHMRLPKVLEAMTSTFWKCKGEQAQGVFRVSANTDDVSKLVESVSKNGKLPDDFKDPIAVAELLKQWIRALSIPIFPVHHFAKWIKASEGDAAYCRTVAQHYIPRDHFILLGELMGFFAKLSTFDAVTKMTVANLATVMGLNMVKADSRETELRKVSQIRMFVEKLIQAWRDDMDEVDADTSKGEVDAPVDTPKANFDEQGEVDTKANTAASADITGSESVPKKTVAESPKGISPTSQAVAKPSFDHAKGATTSSLAAAKSSVDSAKGATPAAPQPQARSRRLTDEHCQGEVLPLAPASDSDEDDSAKKGEDDFIAQKLSKSALENLEKLQQRRVTSKSVEKEPIDAPKSLTAPSRAPAVRLATADKPPKGSNAKESSSLQHSSNGANRPSSSATVSLTTSPVAAAVEPTSTSSPAPATPKSAPSSSKSPVAPQASPASPASPRVQLKIHKVSSPKASSSPTSSRKSLLADATSSSTAASKRRSSLSRSRSRSPSASSSSRGAKLRQLRKKSFTLPAKITLPAAAAADSEPKRAASSSPPAAASSSTSSSSDAGGKTNANGTSRPRNKLLMAVADHDAAPTRPLRPSLASVPSVKALVKKAETKGGGKSKKSTSKGGGKKK